MTKYILTREYVTVFHNGNSYTTEKDNPNFGQIIQLLKDYRDEAPVEEIIRLMNPVRSVLQNQDFEIKDDVLYYKEFEIQNSLVKRISKMARNGDSVSHLESFLKNLMMNPSQDSIMELYEFLEKNSLPITEDGYFLAYKKVRGNFTDIHTGQFDNSVGKEVRIPREDVDDDRNRTCSFGLHACSWNYLSSFGSGSSDEDRVVIVKINPADVVSVPVDYDNAKLRTAGYTVIAEIPDTSTKKLRDYAVDTTSGELTEDIEDDEDEFEEDPFDDWETDEEEQDYFSEEDHEEYSRSSGTIRNKGDLWTYFYDQGYRDVQWNSGSGYLLKTVLPGENWVRQLEEDSELASALDNGLFTYYSVPKTPIANYQRVIVVKEENNPNLKPKLFVFSSDRLL